MSVTETVVPVGAGSESSVRCMDSPQGSPEASELPDAVFTSRGNDPSKAEDPFVGSSKMGEEFHLRGWSPSSVPLHTQSFLEDEHSPTNKRHRGYQPLYPLTPPPPPGAA